MQKSENGRWKTKWLYICIEIEGRECQRSFFKLEQIQSEENPKKNIFEFMLNVLAPPRPIIGNYNFFLSFLILNPIVIYTHG